MMTQAVNPNLRFLRDNFERARVICLQGGTRSGKTYSTLQFLIEICLQHTGLTVTIARSTFPALKATAMRDFFEILHNEGLYEAANHNKTDSIYMLNGNMVEFLACDEEQKVRSRKRDVLYVNESNELMYDIWQQLLYRTTGRVILDLNPSDYEHWIYDRVQTREDCLTLITTYKDNPHLTAETINEIERLQYTDPEQWVIFGLGKRGSGKKGLIYTNWKGIEVIPEEILNKAKCTIGVDFGWANDECAIAQTYFYKNEIFTKELFYKLEPSVEEMIQVIKEHIPNIRTSVFVDTNEPRSFKEMYQSGLNVKKAKKPHDSVSQGIRWIQNKQVYLDKASKNAWTEFHMYSWKKDRHGIIPNKPKPIDNYSHFMDAFRYSLEPYVIKKRGVRVKY